MSFSGPGKKIKSDEPLYLKDPMAYVNTIGLQIYEKDSKTQIIEYSNNLEHALSLQK